MYLHLRVWVVAMLVLSLLDILGVLLYAVVLSGYERRIMALLHNRDGPVVWGITGLAQPLVDGSKLLTKGVAVALSGEVGSGGGGYLSSQDTLCRVPAMERCIYVGLCLEGYPPTQRVCRST